ncbi:MAG: hypothetical protein NVS3B12_03040 [Acidimicrobiales bacterium]
MLDDTLVGRTGRVTSGGAITAGGAELGEVMIDGQAYFALPVDPDVAIPPHTEVVVIEHHRPRTVVVTPLP